MHTCNITIDHTKVSADLTDYVVYVNLAHLPSSFWGTVANGGGDIRVFKSNGTTELAREVVSCDTATNTGELHIKFSGTLSGSSNTTIQIHADGTSSEPAVTATYGRNNVWTGYKLVLHMQNNPQSGSSTNSTGSTNGVTIGSMTTGDLVAGKLTGGYAYNFDGTNDGITVANLETLLGASNPSQWSWSFWHKMNDVSGQRCPISDYSGNTDNNFGLSHDHRQTYIGVGIRATGTDYYGQWNTTTHIGNWMLIHGTVNKSSTRFRWYADATERYSNTSINGTNDYIDQVTLRIAHTTYSGSSIAFFSGLMDELRMSTTELSANWITTERNNQNDPSTFYTAESVSTTYNQSVTTTTTASASISRTLTFVRTIAPTVTASVSIAKGLSLLRTISATVTGTASMLRGSVYVKTLEATVTGTATMLRDTISGVLMIATVTGTASMTHVSTFVRTLTATVTGTPLFEKGKYFTRALTATATGTASVAKNFIYTIAMQVVATATATLSTEKMFGVIMRVIARGVVKMRESFWVEKYERQDDDYTLKY